MAVTLSSSPEKEVAPPKETPFPTIQKREEHTPGFPSKNTLLLVYSELYVGRLGWMDGMEWMVAIGHRYSKSTFGANKSEDKL